MNEAETKKEHTMKTDTIENMSVEDLRLLKAQNYNAAKAVGTLAKLWTIAKQLGRPMDCRYGPKHQYEDGGMVIFVDGYGGYMTVRLNGQLVCSTHPCDMLFIPGDWANCIDSLAAKAESAENSRRASREQSERAELLKQVQISAA